MVCRFTEEYRFDGSLIITKDPDATAGILNAISDGSGYGAGIGGSSRGGESYGRNITIDGCSVLLGLNMVPELVAATEAVAIILSLMAVL